ncbi:serine/threonine-protein phosphatase [Streptomyces tendae]|uniref:Serine/threonine-protein phosphatase n=1 Tax=Streptomyces tendae TaxID=1932 RepID=A0ABX5ZWJ1_STRTE|nr:protein phosphatase 2C domain-containing protein [Streptomyces tendae]QER88984.1 serine/threonine-protein phosphatase [Streptomyces tendae]
MSQMPQQAALSKCPSCEEPLESGDRFCGACGYDLSVVPARPTDDPTIALNGAVPPQSAGAVPPPPPAAPPSVPGAPAPGIHPAAPGPNAPAPGTPSADTPAHPRPRPAPAAPGVHAAAQGAPTTDAPAAGTSARPGAPGPHPAAPGVHAAAQADPAVGAPARPAAAAAPVATAGAPAPDTPVVPEASGTHVPAADPHAVAAGAHESAAGRHVPVQGAPARPGHAAVSPTAVQGAPVAGAPAAGVRFDRRDRSGAPDGGAPAQDAPHTPDAPGTSPAHQPAQPDEYPLQAPDPRVAAEPAQAGPAPAVCVACRAGRVDDDGYCENCGHAQPRERDHMEQECGPLAAVSDRGLRHHRNEDAFAVGTTALPDGSPVYVAVVCDGVSSATRPDEASLAASRAANASLLAALPRGTHPQQAMHDAVLAASEAVNALAGEQPAGAREHAPQQNAPACTIVGAVVTAGLLVVGWVGDSRAYWIPVDRSAPPARLTEDDSWAAQMVAAGLMGEAEAYADHRAHAITGWLGADAYDLEPHTAAFKPDRPGVVVVCTDGLWNYAESADEMAEVVPVDAAARPLHAAQVLVGHALDGGGHDNVTVALVPFPAVPQGAGSA